MSADQRKKQAPTRANGAEAFERALARYEQLLASGRSSSQARREASKRLGAEGRRLFALAVSLPRSTVRAPREGFAKSLEAQLSREMGGNVVPMRRPVRGVDRRSWVRSRLGAVSAAACIGILAGLLIESSGALPGSILYPVKRGSENAQVWVASGSDEAKLRLDLAERRFGEVSSLISRAHSQAIGVPGLPVAAAPGNVDDPELVALIQSTLQDAEEQISKAAEILIQTKDHAGLEQLALVAREGRKVTVQAAEDLPDQVKPPVLMTAQTLQRIEVEAKIVQAQGPAPAATPPSCPSPSPSPTPAGSPEASPSPEPSPTASPTTDPAASPSPAPSPDPCAPPSPKPSPEPSPNVGSSSSGGSQPAPAPQPSAQPSQQDQGSSAQAGEGSSKAHQSSSAASQPALSSQFRYCAWFDSLTGRC